MRPWEGLVNTDTMEAIKVFTDAYLEQRARFPEDIGVFVEVTPTVLFVASLAIADAASPMPPALREEIGMGINAYSSERIQDRTLWVAAAYDHLKLVELLLATGASPHEQSGAALRLATDFASPAVVLLLKEAMGEQR